MLKKLLIAISVFLFLSYHLFAQENWDVYMAQYEKGMGTTVLDMDLIQSAPNSELPFCLVVFVNCNECREDGFPIKEEFETLYTISDEIEQTIGENSNSAFAGTFTYQCVREDYFYVADTVSLRDKIEKVFASNFKGYKYKLSINSDPHWDVYLKFLYPNKEMLEYMGNQKVVLRLKDSGDDLSKARQVDHWVYFSSKTDRNNFIKVIKKSGYKIEGKKTMKDSDHPYSLNISRTDYVHLNEINEITSTLRKIAYEFNGDYTGWETFVVTD